MVSLQEADRGMCGDGFTTFTDAEIKRHIEWGGTVG